MWWLVVIIILRVWAYCKIVLLCDYLWETCVNCCQATFDFKWCPIAPCSCRLWFGPLCSWWWWWRFGQCFLWRSSIHLYRRSLNMLEADLTLGWIIHQSLWIMRLEVLQVCTQVITHSLYRLYRHFIDTLFACDLTTFKQSRAGHSMLNETRSEVAGDAPKGSRDLSGLWVACPTGASESVLSPA